MSDSAGIELPKSQSKKDTGDLDNKITPIEYISGIRIKKFRTFENRDVVLGRNVTVLAGRNGTMKTSIMGLIAHPFDSDAKDAFGKPLKTTLKEVFRLSADYDTEKYEYDLVFKSTDNYIHEPVSIYYVAKQTRRRRVVVSGAEKGDGNFSYNTSFLNLKRLYPLVDTAAEADESTTFALSVKEASDLKDFYEQVLPSSSYQSFTPVHQVNLKSTYGPSEGSDTYDWQTISSGEDNLGAIFNRLLGFQRSFSQKQQTGNGILCIDEFESSLHPVAQIKLYDYLSKWAEKYKVQVVLSTHSLHLISYIYHKRKPELDFGRTVVNFVSKSTAKNNNYPILHNPAFNYAYKELTLETPEQVTQSRKIRVFCEDDIAIHFAKRLIKSQTILNSVEFHSSLNPDAASVGTPYSALAALCTQFPLLLERSLVLFDGDVESTVTQKIKNKSLYLTLPDPLNLALERRMILYISTLDNDDAFFQKFDKEKESFLYDFKKAGLKSLSAADIIDEVKTNIKLCKKWATTSKAEFKKYVTYYCDHSGIKDHYFADDFLFALNTINSQSGLPKLIVDKK